jgi:hypothetical protein
MRGSIPPLPQYDFIERCSVKHYTDNIKMGLREIGIYGANWIHLAQDRVRWRAFVNMVMNLLFP